MIDLVREKQHWDEVAKAYDEATAKDAPTKHYTGVRLLEVLRREGRSLEMGCGDGAITDYLARHCESLTVLDASQAQLDAIAERWPKLTYVCSLFESFEPEEPYDQIINSHVMEHVDDPVAIFRRTATWLKPGGRMHVIVPNAESLNRRLGVKMGMIQQVDELGENDYAIGHRRIYKLPLLIEHIEAAGLRVVNASGIMIKPLSGAQVMSWSAEILEGLYKLSRDLPAEMSSELYVEVAHG